MRRPDVAKKMDAAAVYIPFNCEAIRITACDFDQECMYGVGEESGEDIQIWFDDVDLDSDMFYKLVLMED